MTGPTMTKRIGELDESLLGQSADADGEAGFGALRTERGCLPLVAMDVRARITDVIAQTTIRQTFRNTLDEPLEATYIFPLPDRAAVTKFQLLVAGRIIEGQLKERGQAREDYERAIEDGHRAAIAEEERSGVFTIRVGNIPPQEEATIELSLVGPLPVANGEATYRFPLVVAPRYTSGIPLDGPSVGAGVAPDTEEVPDASRVTPPVLLPGFPNPVRLSLEVELSQPAAGQLADGPSAGGPSAEWLARVRSSLHATISEGTEPLVVRLQSGERLDRDFLLRFPVAQATLATSLRVAPGRAEQPGVFALTLLPPQLPADHVPAAREVVFVLDRSGSMSGWKMVAARRAVGRMLDTLLDHDRFTVLAFDNVVERPPHVAQGLVAGTNRQRWQTLEWLGGVQSRGGTEMRPALMQAVGCFTASPDTTATTGKTSTATSSDSAPVERILVIVTDGQVSGEDAILRELAGQTPGAAPRIFTVGIDRAVNAGFLQRLADFGRGACELVESEERLDEAMDRIHRLIGRPVLTGVRLEPLNFDWVQDSLAPGRVGDLFVDRPVTILGRQLVECADLRIRIHARDASGKAWSQDAVGQAADDAGLLSIWGRAKVRDMEDQYAAQRVPDQEGLSKRIVAVSLESHVLSRFTAYVAVDTSEVVNLGGQLQQVMQPVEMPSGWELPQTMACGYTSAPMASLSVDSMMLESVAFFESPRASRPNAKSFERGKSRKSRAAEDSLASFLPELNQDLSDAVAALYVGVDTGVVGSVPYRDAVEALLRELVSREGPLEIRFEPQADRVQVRYMLKGNWVELAPIEMSLYRQILARFEEIAGLDVAGRDQDRQAMVSRPGSGGELRMRIGFTATPREPALTIAVELVTASGKPRAGRKRFWT